MRYRKIGMVKPRGRPGQQRYKGDGMTADGAVETAGWYLAVAYCTVLQHRRMVKHESGNDIWLVPCVDCRRQGEDDATVAYENRQINHERIGR